MPDSLRPSQGEGLGDLLPIDSEAISQTAVSVMREELGWPSEGDPDGATADVLKRIGDRIAAWSLFDRTRAEKHIAQARAEGRREGFADAKERAARIATETECAQHPEHLAGAYQDGFRTAADRIAEDIQEMPDPSPPLLREAVEGMRQDGGGDGLR